MVFEGPNDEVGEDGTPQLPVEVVSLGVPFNSSVVVQLVDPVYQVAENQLVAPKPTYRFTDENEAIAEYRKDPAAYSENRFFSPPQITAETPFTLRQQRISTIRLAPYQYNPATRVLKTLVKVTLKIVVQSGKSKLLDRSGISGGIVDPYFEPTYKSLIVNYEEAKQWRQAIARRTPAPPDPTRDWFETGRIYYRIPVAEDGWYKITATDLAAAGADPTQIDTATVQVFGKGVEVPIVVRPDTSIEFYALHNYGDSTYVDFYTDTSAYWITWGGTAGLRFDSTPQPGGSPSIDIPSAVVTKHYQENTDYYEGATQNDIIENGPVPGEGWTWEYYFPNTVKTHSFELDTIDGTGGLSSMLRVRLFGTTATPVGHHARFWMNDSLVGEIMFPARSAGIFSGSFPSVWLNEGTNVLKVMSIPTQPGVNQFYLDWFEIDYQRFLRAENDQLLFVSPQSSGGSPASFTVTGFSNPQVEIFDLSAKRTISGGTITGNDTIGYSIAFKDTFATAKSYLVVRSSGPKPILPLEQKTFSDIRVNPAGADYIVITHEDFLLSAQQLATHRQAVSGVRATVIDVQDIYDEFNYGTMNATTLKTFLRYAFENWPQPSPAYVLFFGDASHTVYRREITGSVHLIQFILSYHPS
jgi:hypothetical protein